MIYNGTVEAKNNVAESLIGAVVVIAVAMAVLAFPICAPARAAFRAMISMPNCPKPMAGGGTDVRLAGIKIGTVSDMTLDPKTYLVTVHMNIRNDIKLPVDLALVTQTGFLGGQYLSITPGATTR